MHRSHTGHPQPQPYPRCAGTLGNRGHHGVQGQHLHPSHRLTSDVEQDGHGVSSVFVLHQQSVRATISETDSAHRQSADVTVLHVWVRQQLRLVLAVELAARGEHRAAPLPGVGQWQGVAAELCL